MNRFENVDVLAALDQLMRQNTAFYRNDFEIDKEIIGWAAASDKAEDTAAPGEIDSSDPTLATADTNAVLMELAAVLQDLELDWEYELSNWIGPVASALIGGHVRSRANWYQQGFASLNQNLAEYLSEEARTLVGEREAQARFDELDQLNLDLDRLEARFERLCRSLNSSDNA